MNLNTVWTLARDVGAHMLARREAAATTSTNLPNGKIINIASLLSFQGGLNTFIKLAYTLLVHGSSTLIKFIVY